MKPTVICLTPVRNEAWILDTFLKAASLWADHIIIADQMSTDGSREIARQYPKVILVDNNTQEFNEPERQKLLISEARKIQGQRLLITLDADEMFTPNLLTSSEWQQMLASKPGTVFKFQWANIRPDLTTMWYGDFFPWGYMDDGAEHTEDKKIHTARIPLPADHTIIKIEQVKVIHLQYANWKRMLSKHRWYQCFETINFPDKSAVDIFRMYHHMFAIPKEEIIPIPEEWTEKFKTLEIPYTEFIPENFNWFEEQVINLIEQYGASKFKKLRIWDVDWASKAEFFGKANLKKYKDPRSVADKIIQWWLYHTQDKLNKINFRRADRFIRNILKY